MADLRCTFYQALNGRSDHRSVNETKFGGQISIWVQSYQDNSIKYECLSKSLEGLKESKLRGPEPDLFQNDKESNNLPIQECLLQGKIIENCFVHFYCILL